MELEPDLSTESLLLNDLRPTTPYLFKAVLSSTEGTAEPILSNISTPEGTYMYVYTQMCIIVTIGIV